MLSLAVRAAKQQARAALPVAARACTPIARFMSSFTLPSNVVLDEKSTAYLNKSASAGASTVRPPSSIPVRALLSAQPVEGQSLELSPAVWHSEPRADLVARAARWHLANLRTKTFSTLARGEVSGSTRKIAPQKGRGAARLGQLRYV